MAVMTSPMPFGSLALVLMVPLGTATWSSVLPGGTSMVWMPPSDGVAGRASAGGAAGFRSAGGAARPASGGGASRSPGGGAPMSDGGGCARSGGRGGHSITDEDCASAVAAQPSTQAVKNARRTSVIFASCSHKINRG